MFTSSIAKYNRIRLILTPDNPENRIIRSKCNGTEVKTAQKTTPDNSDSFPLNSDTDSKLPAFGYDIIETTKTTTLVSMQDE